MATDFGLMDQYTYTTRDGGPLYTQSEYSEYFDSPAHSTEGNVYALSHAIELCQGASNWTAGDLELAIRKAEADVGCPRRPWPGPTHPKSCLANTGVISATSS